MLITKEAALLQSALEDKTRPFPAPYLQLVLLQTPHIVSEVLLPLLRDVKLPHLPEDLTPPPGLFIWAISNVDKLRAFSLDQIHHLQSCMLEDLQEQYIPNHSALAFVLKQLGLRSRSTQAEEFESGQYMISQQPDVLWRSLQRIVTRLDSRIILRATFDAVRPVEDIGVRCAELVRLVCSHLGDTGSHWAAVLHTFAALLDKCQSHLWGGEDPAYSGIVMHAILDNPQLEISMQSKKDVFGWAIPFIDSVKETPLLQPHLSAILNILCVRLQLPRFEVEFRVAGARAGVRLLLKVFVSGLNHSPLSSRLQNIKADILEVHMPFLSRISFTQPYACLLSSSRTLSPTEQNDRLEEHRAWIKVSTEARRLVGHLLKQDNRAIASYQLELADYLFTNNVEADVPQLKICQTAWKNCYRDISTSKQNQSVNFAGIMLLAFAPVAHLERPLDKVWLSDAITGSKLKPVIRRLQAHFDSAIEPLSDLLSDVADASPSKSNFIAQDHVCQDIVAALLSPSEVVHNSALTVIREAYDGTDTREHCFRALLLNHPVSTITGLQKTCESFTFAGAALPDACGEAMRLARCLSSVLDALCDPEDGLLRDESWLDQDGVRTALPQLWETLCETSARIYEKTPEWSAHHENDRMTVWMRDAIIFGRSLADQIRAFEAASTGASVGESPQKVSNIGAQLVKKMNRTVEALSSWLRLTDAELLRSTCDLLVKFVERLSRFQVALSFKTLRRIKKYATASSSHDSDRREAFKIIIVLQSHPCHREDFEGLAAPLEPEPQPKRMPNRPLTIEIDDDDEEDKEVEFLGKQQAKLQINQQQRSASTSSIPSNSMSQPKASTSKSSERSGKRPTATVSGALARQAAKGPLKAKKDSQSLLVKPPKLKREAPPPPRQTFSHAALRKMQNSRLAGDSSSAEEDELPKGLASLANPNKRPRVEVPEKRQVISIPKPNEDLASIKDERSAKALAASEAKRAENAARLRAAPDFSGLHRTLLQWVC